MSGSFMHDFNGAEAQQNSFDLIPNGTLVKVRLTIRPGGVGPEGWVTQSRTSDAQYLNTEAVILEGPHTKRRIYTRIGLRGKGAQGADDTYANRGRALIRGILESARGIAAKDTYDFLGSPEGEIALAQLVVHLFDRLRHLLQGRMRDGQDLTEGHGPQVRALFLSVKVGHSAERRHVASSSLP